MLAAPLALAAASPALAQDMYPGQSVTVNPAALGQLSCGGCGCPCGGRPSGAGRNLPPVHLHPLKPHTHHSHHAAARAPADQPAAESPAPDATPQPAHKPVRTHAAHRHAAPAPATIPFSFGGDDGEDADVPMQTQAVTPERTRTPAAKRVTRDAVRRAAKKATPLPRIAQPKGLTKQQVVLFDSGATSLSDNSRARLNDLAFSLKTALANGASEVELIAYGGSPGDKSSAARRLSLKRALAVREALIVDGVPAARIDVRAQGGVKQGDNGATDRVDIFVKA
jgi:outer membrane protein OmpA-like peptidoglycan-associated protein